ncbi:MAG: hypothetical protein P4L69_19320 [Desulfosporosinus sp.]|nr:hypothetical protein [Desulfosporosinus sp.]
MITVIFSSVVLLILLTIILKLRTGFNEIDKKYGKPYQAKLVNIISDHPDLKRGSMAISLHPKNAIAFNRKVFLFSQISSIKIISELPGKLENSMETAVNSGKEERYLSIAVVDKYGEHEIIFSAKSNFKEVANLLIQKWHMYNIS